MKISRDWIGRRNFWSPKQFPSNNSAQTYSDSFPLSSCAQTAAWKAPDAYGEQLICPASGRELGGSFLPDRSADRGHFSFSESSLHRATEPADGRPIWDSNNLAHTVCPTLVIPWGPAPPKFWAHPSCFQWVFHPNGLSWPMLQIFLNSLKQATSGFSKPCNSLSDPRNTS